MPVKKKLTKKSPYKRIGKVWGAYVKVPRSKDTHGIYYSKITEQKARDRVNHKLAQLSSGNGDHTYYRSIPWGKILDAVVSEGFDGAIISGVNDNKPGRVHVNVGGNTWLLVTWYIMPVSKKYEVIAYVS